MTNFRVWEARHLPAMLGLVLLGSVGAEASAADYEVGYSWVRQAQWQDGAVVGSSLGNPGPDSLGSAVWGYWTTLGDGTDGLGSDAPWYAAERTAMVWDEFQKEDDPVRYHWARDGGAEPAIGKTLISTSRTPAYGGWLYRAMASWQNPVGDGAVVDIAGTARLVWGGPGNKFVDYGVELAIVMFDVSADDYVPLLTAELQRPETAFDTNRWELLQPVDIQDIAVDAGDQILFTIKNEDSTPAPVDAWVSFYDKVSIDLTSVSAVPEPASWALFASGLAGLVVLRRSRRTAAAPLTQA